MHIVFYVNARLNLCMVHPVIAHVALGTKLWLLIIVSGVKETQIPKLRHQTRVV